MNSDRNLPHYQQASLAGNGMPEESVGTILQRGGDELILEKVSDRFAAAPVPGAPATWVQQIPATQHRTVTHAPGATIAGQLEEFIVPPSERDRAMLAARTNDSVAFASHIYQLQADPGTLVYLTDQMTIQFAPDVEAAVQTAIASSAGLRSLKPISGIPNAFVYQVTNQATENPIKIANRLMGLKEILVAEPNIIISAQSLYRPRDPLYSQQWYLAHNGGSQLAPNSHIDAEKAWDITRGIRPIVIAVADDAVDLNHPDFQGIGKIVAPRDFKDRDFLPQPVASEENHGTACAGVCVAEENGSGIVGVAPGCALMPIRTTGFLDDESIEQIFDWAVTKGAAVISCSWGPAAVSFPLSLRQSAALNRAATQGRRGKGCIIVFAAGNANRPINGTINEQGWPNNALSGNIKWLAGFAVHPDVIAVSACTSLNQKAAYSNWGQAISVCAPSNNAPPGIWLQQTGFILTPPEVRTQLPGLGVFTTDRTGAAGYNGSDFTGDFGGTSSATPVVAGVAALVLSVNPNLTATEVKRILQQTADKIVDTSADPQFGFRKGTYSEAGHSEWFGYGKVNAYKAVVAAQRLLTANAPASRQLQGKNEVAVAIPDYNLQGTSTGISISDSSLLKDIQVTVDIDHTFLGDIEVSLVAPNNQSVLLQGRTLGRSTKLKTTYTLQTTPALRQFLGLSVRGTWKLLVVDFALGDTGRLNNWQLSLGV